MLTHLRHAKQKGSIPSENRYDSQEWECTEYYIDKLTFANGLLIFIMLYNSMHLFLNHDIFLKFVHCVWKHSAGWWNRYCYSSMEWAHRNCKHPTTTRGQYWGSRQGTSFDLKAHFEIASSVVSASTTKINTCVRDIDVFVNVGLHRISHLWSQAFWIFMHLRHFRWRVNCPIRNENKSKECKWTEKTILINLHLPMFCPLWACYTIQCVWFIIMIVSWSFVIVFWKCIAAWWNRSCCSSIEWAQRNCEHPITAWGQY